MASLKYLIGLVLLLNFALFILFFNFTTKPSSKSTNLSKNTGLEDIAVSSLNLSDKKTTNDTSTNSQSNPSANNTIVFKKSPRHDESKSLKLQNEKDLEKLRGSFIPITHTSKYYKKRAESDFLHEANPFKKLAGYDKVEAKYLNSIPNEKNHYDKMNYGLIHGNSYCDVVDLYNLNNPQNILTGLKFFSDYPKTSILRNFSLKQMGEDTMPYIEENMQTIEDKVIFDRINIIYF